MLSRVWFWRGWVLAVLLFVISGCATRPVVDPEFQSRQMAAHGVGIIGVTTAGAGLHPFTERFERIFQQNFQKRSSVALVIPRQLVPSMDRKRVRAFLKGFSEVPRLAEHDLSVFDPIRSKVRFLVLAHIHLDEIQYDASSSSCTPTTQRKNLETGEMEEVPGDTEYTITHTSTRKIRLQTLVIDLERQRIVWDLTDEDDVGLSNSNTSTSSSVSAPEYPTAPSSVDVMEKLVERAVKRLFAD